MNVSPQIPENAPFSLAQRLWLNGYLAALVQQAAGAEAQLPDSAPKPRIVVIYASQSGNGEGLAESFGESLGNAGFDPAVMCAEDHGEIDLAKEKFLILVSSTWGEGDPPENGVEFWEALSSGSQPKLENLGYAVLALGDSNYLDFCAMGKKFDARLAELGAKRLVDRADCDTDFEETAEQWFQSVLSKLESAKSLSNPASKPASTPAPIAPLAKDEGPAAYSKKNPFPAPLLSNRPLNSPGSERDTRHFEFSLEGSGLEYEVGDVIGVIPRNDPGLVDDLLEALEFDGKGAENESLRDQLMERYDIRTLNLKFLKSWQERSGSASLEKLIRDFQDNPEALEEYLWGREIIDVMLDFPATLSGASELTSLLRTLAPRLYSISSSPKANPGEVHLTIANVAYASHGRERKGVCSSYLAERLPTGEPAELFLQKANHFKLPADVSTPMIMVGPGTGIAPFRAFLQEREAIGAPGENWLFFGNPHESTDWLYREEIEGMLERGVLKRFDTAWSRDQENKVYVQDRILESGAEVWSWLEKGAHFYVCGDAKRMAKDVDAALHTVIAGEGGLTIEEAANLCGRT